MSKEYTKLEDLFVYKLSLELCDIGWDIYKSFDWHDQKIIGDQFIRSVDSNAANIAEGYGRFHYLDRIKFYYNARASLIESKHWCQLMFKRRKITQEQNDKFINRAEQVHFHLNRWIKRTFSEKKGEAFK